MEAQQRQHAPGGAPPSTDVGPQTYGGWALDAAWRAWLVVDGAVAWLFGLDESKYQWAIDRHERQQAELALQARAYEGELSTSAPHQPPSSKAMSPDEENPWGRGARRGGRQW